MRRRAILLLTAMAVVLTLVAIPAIAETKNGPIVASFSASEQIVTIDPTTGQRSAVPGAIGTEPSVTPDGKTVVFLGMRMETWRTEETGSYLVLPLMEVPLRLR